MAENDNEKGLKWLARYVLIPLGVAALGLIGYLLEHQSSPATNAPIASGESKEAVDFYLSSKYRARDEHESTITIGETVVIHWNVTNARPGKLFLKEVDTDGDVVLNKEVGSHGMLKYDDTFHTADCILEREDDKGGRTQLGSLRITAVH